MRPRVAYPVEECGALRGAARAKALRQRRAWESENRDRVCVAGGCRGLLRPIFSEAAERRSPSLKEGSLNAGWLGVKTLENGLAVGYQ